MAIAFDATSGTNSGFTASDNFSHTCTGSDLCLLVWVMGDRDAGTVGSSSVTYNGSPMTQVGSQFTNGNQWGELFRLTSPSTGSNTVAATYDNGGGSVKMVCRAVSFTGVHQGTPTGSLVGADDFQAEVGSTSVGEVVVDVVLTATGGITIDADGRTEYANVNTGYGVFGGSYKAADAGTTNMNWNIQFSDLHSMGAVALKPAGGGAAATKKLLTLGVG